MSRLHLLIAGLVLVGMGASKLAAPDQLATFLEVAHGLTVPTAEAAARSIAWTELLLGVVTLFVSARGHLVVPVAGAILALSIGALAYTLAMDVEVSCGCFGTAVRATKSLRVLVSLALAYLALSAVHFRTARRAAPAVRIDTSEGAAQ